MQRPPTAFELVKLLEIELLLLEYSLLYRGGRPGPSVKVEHVIGHNHCLGWTALRWRELWLKRDRPVRKLNTFIGSAAWVYSWLGKNDDRDFAKAESLVSGMQEAFNGH